jgi:hypothetical protein
MSVILECRPGDEFVCIQEFHASPDGEGFSWDTSRHFRVGERLWYVGSRREPRFQDQPNAWMVLFEAADRKQYAAVEAYFVTEERWQGIKRYFARKLLGEPRRSTRHP